MIKTPNLSDLSLYVLVVKHASFIGAATESNLAQATVSKRIALLEASLGVKLLLRTTRTVKVTDEGMKVYHWAQRIFEAVTDMQDDIATTAQEITGPLRISASPRIARDFVAPALAKLKGSYPSLDIWLETVDRKVDLMQEDFHLDVRSGITDEPNLIGYKIAEASRILCASPQYLAQHGTPESADDIKDHQCLLFRDRNEPFGLWDLQGPNGNQAIRIRSELASNNNEIVLDWAIKGQGIMMAADWFLAPHIQRGELVRVLPNHHQPVGIWAISTQRSNQSAKVEVFLEYLKQEVAAQMLGE